MIKQIVTCIGFSVLAVSDALAARHFHHVPEIDGPAGVAVGALLAGVVLLAYNRFKRK